MKRDLSVITPEVRVVLEDWLTWGDKNKKMLCPFLGSPDSDCRVCYALFPGKSTSCPCNVSGLKYVVKIVKQVLKDSA